MSKKIKFSRKDTFLLISGILISFMIQAIYDILKIWIDLGNFDGITQISILAIVGLVFAFLTLLLLRNVNEG